MLSPILKKSDFDRESLFDKTKFHSKLDKT